MVNFDHERLFKHGRNPLEQWLTSKRASQFFQVGRLPKFKIFLGKNEIGRNFPAIFFGKYSVFFLRPGVCKIGNDTPPRLGDIGFQRKNSEDVTNSYEENQSIGTKMLSARLAKVLNLWTTTLTRCLCNARDHVRKSGENTQKTINRDNSGGARYLS